MKGQADVWPFPNWRLNTLRPRRAGDVVRLPRKVLRQAKVDVHDAWVSVAGQMAKWTPGPLGNQDSQPNDSHGVE